MRVICHYEGISVILMDNNEIINEIKTNIDSGNLIIGFNNVERAVKKDAVKKIIIASNIPKDKEDTLKNLAVLNSCEVFKISTNNEDLGAICKKQYNIVVVGLV